MNTANPNQVDDIIDKETHQGDTFALIRDGNHEGWVKLEQ